MRLAGLARELFEQDVQLRLQGVAYLIRLIDDTPAHRLGRKLKEARIAAGFESQEEFGASISMHRTTVNKIEGGKRRVSAKVLRLWCDACGVDYELYEASARLARVAAAAPVPFWFEDFRKAQILARMIFTWHPYMIPGPLQTPEYLTAMHEGAGTPRNLIEERVAARIDLQRQTLDRQPVPVVLRAVMDEAALHRQVGTSEVMHAQLMHMVELGQRENVGIQIIPASRAANAGNVGPFTIASTDDGDMILMDALEDMTTDKRSAVRAGLDVFDRVRLISLSGPESLELIAKVADNGIRG